MLTSEKYSKIVTTIFWITLLLLGSLLIYRFISPYIRTSFPESEFAKNITLKSEMPGYDLDFLNESSLREGLNKSNFWSTNGVYNYRELNNKYTAGKLIVTLKEQVEDPFSLEVDSKQNPILVVSAKVNPVNSDVLIDIFVEPDMKKSPDTTLGSFFDFGFWKSIYLLTRFQGSNSSSIGDGAADSFAESMTRGKAYFNIISK